MNGEKNHTTQLSIIDKEKKMEQRISLEEISRLEENCRRMRSEAIFNTFASLFRGIGTTISALTDRGRKAHGRFEGGRIAGAQAR